MAPNFLRTAEPTGTTDESLEYHMHCIEFVRLQIGSKWYVISDLDQGKWRHVARFKWSGGHWWVGHSLSDPLPQTAATDNNDWPLNGGNGGDNN